ncbi:MAG: DMT family transporter, partial [Rhizobiales bacterium]|nr:DMT family transporter [Hyphomicrobiales bacterium]
AFFICPILSYFLSAILLKEKITLPRTLLLLVGFIGVLLVVKPGLGMKPGLGYALLAGCSYSLYLVTSRWLSDIARPRMMLMSQLMIGGLLLAPLGITDIPDLTDVWTDFLIFGSALSSAIGNLFLLMAYRRIEASRLAPLIYLQLVAGTIFGFTIFGDVPDMISFAGLALLMLSGFGSFWLAGVGTKAQSKK